MRHKFLSFCLAAWFLLMMPMTVKAQHFDDGRLGSISVILMEQDRKTPISGASLSLYYVASVNLSDNNRLLYCFTDAFDSCGTTLDDPTLSARLDAFVEEHATPAATCSTDQRGQVDFSDLPLGLYFIKQTNTVPGYAPCMPFLVTVPYEAENGYVYDVDASPKTAAAKHTSITVKKIWNSDISTPLTDSVTVQLLRDGVVIETAVLNADNHWQVTYTDMPESDAYSIVEVNIPKGFTATYSKNGYVFTVTNSASLAQTGQLIWPIPILAAIGLILIAVGIAALQKTRVDHA